jgi:predicted HicB family RNase H-like nuclease
MNTTAHDFVTVDMRGLKAALVARAQADRVSVSVLVRGAVARDLGLAVEGEHGLSDVPSCAASRATSVKLSIRMSAEEARKIAAGASAAGLSRGAYLAGLIANVPVLSSGGGRAEHIVALMASCAELSTLSRNVHRLTALLRQANVEPARPYREMLDTIAIDVRRHLESAARVLADLQPQSRSARPTARSAP